MNDTRVLISIFVIAAVTAALRAIPFLLLGGKKTPKWLSCLGGTLPCAMMGMLVVYCLKGVSFAQAKTFVPELAAAVLVCASYVWKRNTLLSILLGTAAYMVMVQGVFA